MVSLITDANISAAVALWEANQPLCITTYGQIEAWDTSNIVLGFKSLFEGNQTFEGGAGQDISKWNTDNATDFEKMFKNANVIELNFVRMTNWNVSKATKLKEMFRDAPLLLLDAREWDVKLSCDVNDMFKDADLLQGKFVNAQGFGNTPDIAEFFHLNTLELNQRDTLISLTEITKFDVVSNLDGIKTEAEEINIDTTALLVDTAAIRQNSDVASKRDDEILFNIQSSLTELEAINIDTTGINDKLGVGSFLNGVDDNTGQISNNVIQIQGIITPYEAKIDTMITLLTNIESNTRRLYNSNSPFQIISGDDFVETLVHGERQFLQTKASPYTASETSTIKILISGTITTATFDSEANYDILRILDENNVDVVGSPFSGSIGPVDLPVGAEYTILWESDGSIFGDGWKLEFIMPTSGGGGDTSGGVSNEMIEALLTTLVSQGEHAEQHRQEKSRRFN